MPLIISYHVIFDTFNTYGQCPYDVIPVLDTGIQTLIVILVNKSGENRRSSQNAVFLLK